MTKKELTAFEKVLISKGYQKRTSEVFDYHYRWEKMINPGETPRACVIFDVYDWSEYEFGGVPPSYISASAVVTTPGKEMSFKTIIEFWKSIEVEYIENTVINYMKTISPCC